MEPSILVLFFPVFYVLLAVDLLALCAAVAFLVVDWRARRARAHDWRVDTPEDYRRAACADVTSPKFGADRFVDTPANCVWFSALNDSNRNCSRTRA